MSHIITTAESIRESLYKGCTLEQGRDKHGYRFRTHVMRDLPERGYILKETNGVYTIIAEPIPVPKRKPTRKIKKVTPPPVIVEAKPYIPKVAKPPGFKEVRERVGKLPYRCIAVYQNHGGKYSREQVGTVMSSKDDVVIQLMANHTLNSQDIENIEQLCNRSCDVKYFQSDTFSLRNIQ